MLSEWPFINLFGRILPTPGFRSTKGSSPCVRNTGLAIGLGNAIYLRLQLSLTRHSSSSSSRRWQARHGRDKFAREARVQGLKSRAAFKLLEVGLTTSIVWRSIGKLMVFGKINEKYKIFEKGQTVVDLVNSADVRVIWVD